MSERFLYMPLLLGFLNSAASMSAWNWSQALVTEFLCCGDRDPRPRWPEAGDLARLLRLSEVVRWRLWWLPAPPGLALAFKFHSARRSTRAFASLKAPFTIRINQSHYAKIQLPCLLWQKFMRQTDIQTLVIKILSHCVRVGNFYDTHINVETWNAL